MKNILFFNDTLMQGGTEALLVDILNHVSGKGYKATLLLPYPSDNDILIKDISGRVMVKYIFPEKPKRFKKVFFENLMSFLPKIYGRLTGIGLKKYDTIVCFKDSIYSIVFSRINRHKVLWIHNLPVEREYKIGSLKEYLPVKLFKIRMGRLYNSFRRFDDVICVSQACKNKYVEIYNRSQLVNGQNLEVLYNSLDLNRIKALSGETVNFKPSHPAFVMVTRFSPEKREDRVIESAKRLKNEGYNFRVIIIGEGLYMQQMKSLALENGLEGFVSFPGFKKNPYPYIKQCDWLICSSERESFSLVLLESISLGTPVVTTDCGGPGEIVDKGKYGFLTENTTEGVYYGMKSVLDKPDLFVEYISRTDECLQRFDYTKWLESVDRILKI